MTQFQLLDLWQHIFDVEGDDPTEEARYLCLFSGHREEKATKLSNVQNMYFAWPGEWAAAVGWARGESDRGRESYFCAHLLTERKRIRENAARVNTLYADGDGAEVPLDLPQPTAVVATSSGREQFFWKLDRPLAPEEAERLNKSLSYAIGADTSGWDLTQLLRVPGTINHKYSDTPVVEILDIAVEVRDPSDLESLLPNPDVPDESSAGNTHGDVAESDTREPPVRLGSRGRTFWSGENAKLKEDGRVDRSASLLRVGRVLYNAGATRGTIVSALEERDSTLCWHKYTDRTDADYQYSKIVDKLEETGPNDSRHDLPEMYLNTRESPGEGARSKVGILGERILLGRAIEEGIDPPEELVDEVLLQGKVHQIYAEAGSGKSWMALWLTKELVERGEKVLYLDSENGQRIFSGRLKALGVDTTHLDSLLYYHYISSLPCTDECRDVYIKELQETEPSLVIFDSWINFLAGVNLDENQSADIASWSARFIHPARKRDISVVILDHVPKDGKSSRGSGRKKEEVDVQWELKNTPFDRDRLGGLELTRRKDREGWLPYKVGFSIGGAEGDEFIFERSDEGPVVSAERILKDRDKKAMDILTDNFAFDGATDAQWKSACMEAEEGKQLSRPTYYRAKGSLLRMGHVMEKGDKFYPQGEGE